MTKVKLTIVLILISASFGAGWKHRDQIADVDELKFQVEVAEYQAALQERLDNVEYIKPDTQIIEKEIIKYVKSDPVSCQLDSGWVRLHDGAATGTMPNDSETATISHGSTEAIETITENYGSCRETIAKLEALQKWVDELRN
jgi:hypothetical protein